jgi:microcompartment protein CcmK/EutM
LKLTIAVDTVAAGVDLFVLIAYGFQLGNKEVESSKAISGEVLCEKI